MKLTQFASAMVLTVCAAMAHAQSEQGGGATPKVDSRDPMQQVELDYKNAKDQCQQAKDRKHCLDEAKAAYKEAKSKVKDNVSGQHH